MATQYSFYTIIADAYIYEGSEKRTHVKTDSWSKLASPATVNTTQFPVIVDSGTTLLYLPTGKATLSTATLEYEKKLTSPLDRSVRRYRRSLRSAGSLH